MADIIKLIDRGIRHDGMHHFSAVRNDNENVIRFQCHPLEVDEHMLVHMHKEAERLFG